MGLLGTAAPTEMAAGVSDTTPPAPVVRAAVRKGPSIVRRLHPVKTQPKGNQAALQKALAELAAVKAAAVTAAAAPAAAQVGRELRVTPLFRDQTGSTSYRRGCGGSLQQGLLLAFVRLTKTDGCGTGVRGGV